MTTTTLSFRPQPAAAPALRMLTAQTRMELRLLLRNGEQVGLTLLIPLLLEFFFKAFALGHVAKNGAGGDGLAVLHLAIGAALDDDACAVFGNKNRFDSV